MSGVQAAEGKYHDDGEAGGIRAGHGSPVVILSGVAASQHEAATESKDPYLLHYSASLETYAFPTLATVVAMIGLSTSPTHSQANGLVALRMTTIANDLTLRIQNLPDLTIDAGGIPGGGVNRLHPFFIAAVELGGLQKIGGLQDCLQRIAEIVGQAAKVGHGIDRLSGIFHDGLQFEQSALPL
jgi:hypothetical protein